MKKNNMTKGRKITIDESQTDTHRSKTTIHQRTKMGNAFRSVTHLRTNSITFDAKHVQFRNRPSIATYHQHIEAKMLTYDSGVDGHYLSEKDRKQSGLMILRVSAKKVGVVNGCMYNGTYVSAAMRRHENKNNKINKYKYLSR